MEWVEIIKVIILGIVEGITEWLPISSTGHMLLVDAFMPLNLSEAFKEMFFVVIQLGAILAVVVLFWEKMFPFQWRGGFRADWDIFGLWIKVAVACIPSGVLGILYDDFIEENFGTPMMIATMLIVYGVLFILVERWNRSRRPKVKSLDSITFGIAFAIGLFQVLSLIPGTSRSGATIVGALIIGVSRIAAAEFTFFLAVPTMLGASAFKLLKFGFEFTGDELFALGLGMTVAFVVSILAIKFLMSYIKRNDFTAFGWYRIVLGILVIAYFAIIG